MEQLCRKINMPGEVTRKMVELNETLPVFPCLDLLMQEQTWAQGLEQLILIHIPNSSFSKNSRNCLRVRSSVIFTLL